MAGTLCDESGVGSSSEGISNAQQRCQAGEALAEWRSSEQVENGTPSTSPPFWDADDYDDCGPKPSALYGKYKWNIDKYSQINKKELRSDAFEIGGYKWYILIYPQGCDVCNHLSLFLCVADHDNLLPGWSHFAQFTIAVVNKDPKKSKYSDTLHRFWKKEHDWGWKKFMEQSKVRDGFIDSDTLIIKAQVQVIRERADRPFRCLDTQYRRELVRVYLSNVEQICRSYVDKIRAKIGGIIDDAPRWSSFCTYWLGIDLNARNSLSSKKKDSQMFKHAVEKLFVEKEVTSTLVMDSLYSGIKSLEAEIKNSKVRSKYFDGVPMPIVLVDKDTFVLVEDVVILLEKAAVDTLPPKDEMGPPNRVKDGSFGEDFTRDSIERDERRLTEIGRRTIEIIVAEYIFSNKIDVAYQETVALRIQEELLREEEAAWLAVSDKKAKRGAAEKEKKSKKKQGKQKRNNPKGKKDNGRDAKPSVEEKRRQESRTDERKDLLSEVAEVVLAKPNTMDDVSDMSDSVECATEDRESSPINWDTDASEVHLPTEGGGSGVNGLSVVTTGGERKSPSLRDDSSSTCSTDSLPSVVMNGSYKGNSHPIKKTQKSPSRGWSLRGRETGETTGWANDTQRQTSKCLSDVGQANDVFENRQVAESETKTVLLSLQDRVKCLEQHVVKKEEVVSLQRKLTVKDEVNTGTPPKKNTTEVPPSLNKLSSAAHLKPDSKINGSTNPITIRKPDIDNTTQRTNKAAAENGPTSRPYARNGPTQPTEKPTTQPAPVPTEKPTTPRVPLTSGPITPVVSLVQTVPLLSRSVSAAGRLGPDLSPVTHSSGPQNASPADRLGPEPSPPPTHSYSGPQNTSTAGRLGPDPSPSAHISGPQNASHVGRLGRNSAPSTHSYGGIQNASPASRLGTDASPSTHSYGGPQSYRNVMMGNSVNSPQSYSQPPAFVSTQMMGNSVNSLQSYSQPPALLSTPMMSNSVNSTQSYLQPPALVSASVFLSPSSERTDPNTISPSLSHGMVNNLQNIDLYRHAHGKSQDHFPAEVPAGPSQRQTVMADDFPHLDIINELLDDGFQNFSNRPWSGAHNLNRQYTFPGELGMLNDVGPSTTSSRFERTRSYNDNVLEQGYPQANVGAYSNGRIDGLVPNQWQMNDSDLSYLSLRNGEDGGYPYHIPGYSNLPYGVDGYTVYRP